MIDTTKLKYYRILCEKGVLDNQKKDLDDLINTLEEKQFEYLKRLETTKDEGRKDEINELLNTIDLQVKELAAIKTTLSSGIILENALKETTDRKTQERGDDLKEGNEKTSKWQDTTTQKNGKGSSKSVIAIIVLAFVIAISAFAITRSISSLNRSTDTGNTELAENESLSDQTEDTSSAGNNNDSDQTKFGINGIDEGLSAQEQLDAEDEIFTEGYYVFDITNKSLLDGGLELGDKIISMNGESVLTTQDLYDITAKYNPGDEMTLVVERNHKEYTVTGNFVKEADLLPYKSGVGTFKVNGHTIEFNYDEGMITLKD